MDNDPQTTPTPDDIAMASMVIGDASEGEMVVSDGEVECSGCDAAIEAGAPVYWRGHGLEYDPFCGACVIREADNTRAICDVLERGELTP